MFVYFIMIRFNYLCIPNFIFGGVFFFLTLLATSIFSMEAEVRLSPPGMRSIKKPTLFIPADYSYPNRPIPLPHYLGDSGEPAAGWSAKYVATRRFASDQSAWIYYRSADLSNSALGENGGFGSALRIWPVGTTLVIEIYKGDARLKNNQKPVEIAVMSKIDNRNDSPNKSFYSANWNYERFQPHGASIITPAKVHECHQCHSIAFHLTGDLVFTQFP